MKKQSIIFLILLLLIMMIISGCTENVTNQNNDDENGNKTKDPNPTIFSGNWKGKEINNNIPLNITFHSNGSGVFDNTSFIWKINNSILELGMFDGQSTSYYTYQFAEEETKLILQNKFAQEQLIIYKT